MKIYNFASDYRYAMELEKARKLEVPQIKKPITVKSNVTDPIPARGVAPETSPKTSEKYNEPAVETRTEDSETSEKGDEGQSTKRKAKKV